MSQAQILSFPSPTVSLINGRPATTSLEVAKFFSKRHDSVLRDVRGILEDVPIEMGVHNFVETPYTDEQNGQTYPMFTIYFDGFILLVMGYTGKKAMQIKITYIMAFNAMKAQISGNALPPLSLDISTTAERKPLEKLVKVWISQAGIPHAQAWAQVDAHFNLGSITELPTKWIADAINFVEGKIGALPKAPRRTVKALPPAKPFIPEKGREVMERVLALRGTLYRVNAEMRDIMCAPFWDNLMSPYPDNFKPFAKAMHSATWAFVMSVDKELETAALLFEAFVEAEKVLRT